MPNSAEGIKAEFFKALGHPARIRILNALRDEPELSVSQLQDRLDLEQSVVSHQLSVLRAKGLLESRKIGTTVLYTVRDARIHDLLATALAIISHQVVATRSLLEEYDASASATLAEDQETLPQP